MNFLLNADFSSVMSTIFYIIVAVLVLLIMITVHEFGHYIVGKAFKFKIDEFAIGFGPAIYKKTKANGEVFSIRALPLGGFCAFAGEDELEEERKEKHSDSEENSTPSDTVKAKNEGEFNSKPCWQRILVLISGAAMNFILAIIIAGLFLGIYGCTLYKVEKVADSTDSAFTQVFEVDDVIVSADGKNIYMVTDFMSVLNGKEAGDAIPVEIIRNGERVTIDVTLRVDGTSENIEDTTTVLKSLGLNALRGTSVRFGFFEMIGRSFEYTFKMGSSIFMVLGQLLTGKLGLSAMGGTVTTITTTASGVQTYGFPYLLQITALIGVNLAIFNLLPIPALDGSKVVFTIIEWIRGKPINRKVESIIHLVGIILLMGFAVLVDLQHCF